MFLRETIMVIKENDVILLPIHIDIKFHLKY